MPGQYPSFVRASLWQMPEACTRMRTWPASGWGISRSTTWYGPLALTTWAARILGIDTLLLTSSWIRDARRVIPRSGYLHAQQRWYEKIRRSGKARAALSAGSAFV